MWLYKCTNNWNNTPDSLVSLHTGASAVRPFLLEQIGCSGASTVSWRRWHCLEDPLSIADVADFASASSRSSPVAQVWIGHSLGKLMCEDIGVVIVRVGEMASSVASTTTYSRDHWAEVRHDNVTMGSCFSMTMKPTEVGATGLSKGRDSCRRLVENGINLEWRKREKLHSSDYDLLYLIQCRITYIVSLISSRKVAIVQPEVQVKLNGSLCDSRWLVEHNAVCTTWVYSSRIETVVLIDRAGKRSGRDHISHHGQDGGLQSCPRNTTPVSGTPKDWIYDWRWKHRPTISKRKIDIMNVSSSYV